MATPAEINAYIDALNRISPSDMVKLIDATIAGQIIDGEGKYVVQAQDDDVLLRVDTLDQLLAARTYFARISGGGIIRRTAEMRAW